MNPYLRALPPLPDQLDPVSLFAPEASLKGLIQQYNLLTYIDYAERLPGSAALRRDLKQQGLNGSTSIDVLLWVLGHTYEVLPIPLTPDPGNFKEVHFLAHNKSVIETIMRSLTQDAALLYNQLHGHAGSMTAIRQVSGNAAYYSDMTNDHRRLFMICRAIVVTSDYRDLFQREPGLMRQDLIRERRQAALGLLEGLIERRKELTAASPEQAIPPGSTEPGSALSVDERTEHRDDSHPFSFGAADAPAVAIPAPARKIALRAVDLPEWREFEGGRKEALDWGMVMRVFGPEIVIRILLRRQDFRQLLAMMEASFVADPSDLRYCLRSMNKIVEHRDLLPAGEEDFGRLHAFIEGVLGK